MKYKDFIAEEDLSHSEAGKAIKVSPESSRRYANGERVPEPEVMVEIYKFSSGVVQPNDFYNLPKLPKKRSPIQIQDRT